MKEGLEEFLRRIEEKPTNETLIDRFVSLVLEEEILDRVLYLKKLVGLLLNLNPYIALKIAALELQEARKERLNKEYEIGALKDVESCFLKLDKIDNAQLVREEISKLMVESSRIQLRVPPEPENVAALDPAADRKAKLHFRLPQGGSDEPTTLGEVPIDPPQEKKPPVPPESQEGRRSALQISAIGVGPNLLDGKNSEDKQKLRNAASLFEREDEYAADVSDAKLDEDLEPQRLSGNIIAESQQLHFPEQTQNLSMTNRYKTALAKPMEVLKAQAAPPQAQKPKEERAFSNPYGEEDTGFRETRPLFPQHDSDSTEILEPMPLSSSAVAVETKASLPAKPRVAPPSAPFTPGLPQSSSALSLEMPPASAVSSLDQRWEMFRERMLLSSGMQIDKKIAQDYLQKQLGLEVGSEGSKQVMNMLTEALSGSLSHQLRQRIQRWIFEESDPKLMHQMWGGLRMEGEAPLFLEAYVSQLLAEKESRRAFHVVRDLAVQGMSLEWAKASYRCLLMLWDALGLKPWDWSEVEGLEAFREKMRRREEISASFAIASLRLTSKR